MDSMPSSSKLPQQPRNQLVDKIRNGLSDVCGLLDAHSPLIFKTTELSGHIGSLVSSLNDLADHEQIEVQAECTIRDFLHRVTMDYGNFRFFGMR
jgi:hypothetical protein